VIVQTKRDKISQEENEMKLPTRYKNVVAREEHPTCHALMIAYNCLADNIEAFKKDSKLSVDDEFCLREYIDAYQKTCEVLVQTIELCFEGITDEEVQREIKKLEARREELTNEKVLVIARLNELVD
jgi:hypothetical protein